MASAGDLEERFQAGVTAIQRLPPNGSLQPSNLTKLIFYGLYKQATVGPCQQSRPSVFNMINRAKWDAWDRFRSMSKEAAMLAYIDEIRKILETVPTSDEAVALKKLIEPSEARQTHDETMGIKSNQDTPPCLLNDHQKDEPVLIPHVAPASSTSASFSTLSSLTSSDVDEYYHDPSDRLSPNFYEIITSANTQDPSMNSASFHPHSSVFQGQNERTNLPSHSTRRGSNYSNGSSRHSPVFHHVNSSNGIRYSISSADNHGRYPQDDCNRQTQDAILTALTKLQNDVHNILERLNRLETSTHSLQQRELLFSSEFKPSLRWLPLAGLRRPAIALILLWPFFAFALIRLFLHAKIIIRFRQRRLV